VAKPELGLKRQCMSCGAKFYDLNKNPITCPKCGTPFQATALSGRAAAPIVARSAPVVEDEPELEAAGPEMVSLDEVEAGEAEKDLPIDEDLEVADEATDDTFLEEEEEGEDDVTGLIDGDIEDDEEA
jgi:uncharacterized protein (TIGR02300 family)